MFGLGQAHWTALALPRQDTRGKTCGICNIAANLKMTDLDREDWVCSHVQQTQVEPCIRLTRGKFKLTNQDSVGGKNSSVLI